MIFSHLVGARVVDLAKIAGKPFVAIAPTWRPMQVAEGGGFSVSSEMMS
jgi:hypothetical protein